MIGHEVQGDLDGILREVGDLRSRLDNSTIPIGWDWAAISFIHRKWGDWPRGTSGDATIQSK
jgi:hypothetical protein